MKPKMIVWDVLNHMNKQPQEEIKGNSIAISFSEDDRYRIEINLKVDGTIEIRKVDTDLSTLLITCNHSNSISVK